MRKRRKALSMFDLADVWGIGPRTFAKLYSLGVTSPMQFADKPGEWVRRHFYKPGYQTWLELNGHPCIDTTAIIQRQTITTSRSFGNMISSKEDIKASVASFAASCCSTLRGQDSSAGCVSVFACSNGTGGENLPPGNPLQEIRSHTFGHSPRTREDT